MPNKPLVIDVKAAAVPGGQLNSWTPLTNTSVFINNIETPKLAKNTNIGKLVSGIPSAFARVDLFKTALDFVANNPRPNAADELSLNNYYFQLSDEWRGLIACIALDDANIKVNRIDMVYSDGNDINRTTNVYEPKGAFGNMLLKRSELWCEQDLPPNAPKIPYINVIKYRSVVVGATAPESLLFTSTGYKATPSKDCPWIDVNTGRLIDPLKSTMTSIQIQSLYAYIGHLVQGLQNFNGYFSNLEPISLRPNYNSITRELQKWQDELEAKANAENIDLTLGCVPPVSADFSGPFKELFCFKDILYGVEGIISEDFKTGSVQFDPKDLLLDENDAKIARVSLNIKPEDFGKLPILVLTARVENSDKKAYFALPLSALGLNVYGKNVAALVGMAGAGQVIASSLDAVYNPNARTNNLQVDLKIQTAGGKKRSFKKVYTSDSAIQNKDILLWPNFISPQWNAYYMYNELPHNGNTSDYKAIPFVGEMQDTYFRIILDEQNKPILLSNNGKIVAPATKVNAELLVECNDAVADNRYKYEIYKSDKPFKGVKLLSPTANEGGYILVNYSSAQGTQLPKDWMLPGATPALNPVSLGVDFGSTNTSIAYSSSVTGEKGFDFSNQRVSLMGFELPGYPIQPRENQVFFFQGGVTPIPSNSIKSILTLHDPRRLPALKQGETVSMRSAKAIVGGFPCFADNLPLSSSDSGTITLNFPQGVGQVKQIHNMKWENDDNSKSYKSAFLKALMLQVYATLFEKGLYPTSLKWSYPSSMMGSLMHSYQLIWNELSGTKLSPVLNAAGRPYNLSVSQYTQNLLGDDDFSAGGFGNADNSTNNTPSFEVGGFGSADNGFGGSTSGFGAGGFGSSDSGFGDSTSGFGAGGFGGSADGFGSTPSFDAGGFGENATKAKSGPISDLLPDSMDDEISYEPTKLYDAANNNSLSEAESVANFISVRYGTEANVLNLCFDVGGSTTDISALFLLQKQEGAENKNILTMIKQNSLRFAAQRVSKCVGNFPNFQNVLLQTCAENNIKMLGLNMGANTYNPDTAPYFFDQIVNRLTPAQLPSFYRRIAADCPQLMCVNMYVTGLLMYYAGQVAHKLIDDLNRTNKTEWPRIQKPNVRVTFAGKGSRLFQWLKTLNAGAANQYYGRLFVMGYGEEHLKNTLAGWQQIILPDVNDPDIKYEVSKGLAKGNTALYKPTTQQPSEIIGESGYQLVGNDNQARPVDFTNSITPDMMKFIGVRFNLQSGANQAAKFTEFCAFFYRAANQLVGWHTNPQELESACRGMNIVAYASQMPEFRAAVEEMNTNNAPFSFVAPVIIMEGMKFYEQTLLNLLKQDE